jgi:GNAT superfamily N-acetyltransferase
MDELTVRRVRGRKDLTRFIKFPWKVYRGNSYWVPPLIVERKKILDRSKNPFYRHAEIELFLAEWDGELAGRIAAIVNHLHNSFHNENIGFFGFFESVNDQAVAKALLDEAREWLRSKGVASMRGPANPSSNDDMGLLINGFHESPAIMMPYNPPYYSQLFEAYGLKKVMDLFAYTLRKERMEAGRVLRLAALVRQRTSVRVRPLNMKNFVGEVDLVKEVYNNAWSSNWGFVPMTDEEFDYLAHDLKQIVDPDLAIFAEVSGRVVGFALALPDLNQVLKKVPSGRLFPFGLLKILLYRSKIDSLRLIITGVIKEYQRRGIDAVLYTEIFERGTLKGIHRAEASWILETNKMMNSGLEAMNAERTKTYRMYEMSISRQP